jgi:P pilus assembly chaperone PapD
MRLFFSLLLLSLLYSSTSFAVSLTSHRIYLDKKHRTESFVIFNREQKSENCKLSFQDFPFDKASNMGKLIIGKPPQNSATSWVRYSPKHFEIKGGSSQTVRFSLRRKANLAAAEYQSYLSIDCAKNFDKTRKVEVISISPRLIHNIPVVARTGTLSATLSISKIHLDKNGKLAFNLNRSGTRSIYGRIDIINKKNNERINYLQGISIYVQSEYQHFAFSLPKNINVNALTIRFTEDKKYGGNIEINKDVNL